MEGLHGYAQIHQKRQEITHAMQSALDALNETSDTVSELAAAPKTVAEPGKRSRGNRRSMAVGLSGVLRLHPTLATPERINAASQCITDLDAVPARFCGVSTLYLSGNALSSLAFLPQFGNVQTLSLAHNKVSSWLELQWLLALPRLAHLRLEGNPVCSTPLYRMRTICLLCPGPSPFPLQTLDGVPIGPADRQAAQRVGQWYSTILAQLVDSERRIHHLALLVKLSAVHLELLGVYWNDGRAILQATGVPSPFPSPPPSQASVLANVLRKVVHNGPALRGALPELVPPNYSRVESLVSAGESFGNTGAAQQYRQPQQPELDVPASPFADSSLIHQSYCMLVERKLKAHRATASQEHQQGKENAAHGHSLPSSLAPRPSMTDAGAAATSVLHMSRAQNLSGLLAAGSASATSSSGYADLAGAGLSPALSLEVSQWAHACSALAGAQAAVIQELQGLLVAAEIRAGEQVRRLGGRDSGRRLHALHAHREESHRSLKDHTGRATSARTASLHASRSISSPATVKKGGSEAGVPAKSGTVTVGVQASVTSLHASGRPRAAATGRSSASGSQRWSASQQRRQSAAFADAISSTRPGHVAVPPMPTSPSRGQRTLQQPQEVAATVSPTRAAAAPVRSLPEEGKGRVPLPGLKRTYDRTVYAETSTPGRGLLQVESASHGGESGSSRELVSGSTRSGADAAGGVPYGSRRASGRPRSAPAGPATGVGTLKRAQDDDLDEPDSAVPIERSVSSLTRGQVRAVIARSKDVLDALRKARLQYGMSTSTSGSGTSPDGSRSAGSSTGSEGSKQREDAAAHAPVPGIAQASAALAAGLASADADTSVRVTKALQDARTSHVGVQTGPSERVERSQASATSTSIPTVPRVLAKLLAPPAPPLADAGPAKDSRTVRVDGHSVQAAVADPPCSAADSALYRQLSALPVPSLIELVERLTSKVQDYQLANDHNARVATAGMASLRAQLTQTQSHADTLQAENQSLVHQLHESEARWRGQEALHAGMTRQLQGQVADLQQRVQSLEAGVQRAENDKRLLAEALHRSESAKDRAWDIVSQLQQQVYGYERDERLRASPWAVDTQKDPFQGTGLRGNRSPSPAGARAVPLAPLSSTSSAASAPGMDVHAAHGLASPPSIQGQAQGQGQLARAVPLRPVAVSPPPPPPAAADSAGMPSTSASGPSPRLRADAGVLFQPVNFGRPPTPTGGLITSSSSPGAVAASTARAQAAQDGTIPSASDAHAGLLGVAPTAGAVDSGRATPGAPAPPPVPSAPPRSPAPGLTLQAASGSSPRAAGLDTREDITAWALQVASSSLSPQPSSLPDAAVEDLNERALEPTARRVRTATRMHALRRAMGTWKHALDVEYTGEVLESRVAGSLAWSALSHWYEVTVAKRQARLPVAKSATVRRESITGLADGGASAHTGTAVAAPRPSLPSSSRQGSTAVRPGSSPVPAAVDGVTAVVASILQQQRYKEGVHGGASTGSHSLETGSEGGTSGEGEGDGEGQAGVGVGMEMEGRSVPLEISALTTDLQVQSQHYPRAGAGRAYLESEADLSAVLLEDSSVGEVEAEQKAEHPMTVVGAMTSGQPRGRGRERKQDGIGYSIYRRNIQPAASLSDTVDSLPSLSSLLDGQGQVKEASAKVETDRGRKVVGKDEASQTTPKPDPPASVPKALPSVVGRPGSDANRASEEWKHSLRVPVGPTTTATATSEQEVGGSAQPAAGIAGGRKRSVSSTASRRGSLSRVVVLPHAYLPASTGTGGGALGGTRRLSSADSLGGANSKRGGRDSRRGSARASPDSLRVPSPAVPIGGVVPLPPPASTGTGTGTSLPSAAAMIRQAVQQDGKGGRAGSPTATHGSLSIPQLQASSSSSLAATCVVDDGVKVRVPAQGPASGEAGTELGGSARRIGHARVLSGTRAAAASEKPGSSAVPTGMSDPARTAAKSSARAARGRAPFR